MNIHKAFRAEFVTSLLIAVFVFAMARAAISEPAPAYNCGDRGVRYCMAGYSYPECGTSEPAGDGRTIMVSQSLGPGHRTVPSLSQMCSSSSDTSGCR
jgi:hypothetical protein